MSQTYLLPPTLSPKSLQAYYDKVQPYKGQVLKAKPSLATLSNVGYLWDSRAVGPLPDDFTELKKGEVYGLHTYGGYYGFFRPDLSEVIGLLSTVIPEHELANIEAIYVTTTMHPNGDLGMCYDNVQDRHRAMTSYAVSYTKPTRRSSRENKGKPPSRFSEQKYLPGSNNKYTSGRKVDTYDPGY